MRRLGWFFLILSLLIGAPTPARAAFELNPFKSARTLINDARIAGQQIVVSAGAEARDTAITIARLLDTLLNNLDHLLAARIDETFEKLDTREQAAFRDISRLIDQANDVTKGRLSEADLIQQGIRDTIEKVAIWSPTTPVLFDYFPRYVRPGGPETVIDLTIRGWRLDQGTPKLLANGREIGRVSVLHGEITISVPRSEFTAATGDLGRTYFVLRTIEDPGRFRRNKNIDFPLTYFSVPDRLATYQLDVRRKLKTPQKEKFQCRLDEPYSTVGNGIYPPDSREYDKCCTPREGWRYVEVGQLKTYSTAWVLTERDPRPEYNGNSAKITYNAPDKVCIFAQSRPLHLTARAKIDAWVEVTEQRTYEYSAWEEKTATGEIFWLRDVTPFELPPDADAFRLTVTFFDGSQRIFTDIEYTHKFLRIDYDPLRKLLTAQPKRPW